MIILFPDFMPRASAPGGGNRQLIASSSVEAHLDLRLTQGVLQEKMQATMYRGNDYKQFQYFFWATLRRYGNPLIGVKIKKNDDPDGPGDGGGDI